MKYFQVFFVWLVLMSMMAGIARARSGCCSHHGGVCGCGCCDVSPLSATCASYYPSCGGGYDTYTPPVIRQPLYIAPTPDVPQTATINTSPNLQSECKMDVIMSWPKTTNSDRFSLAMSKMAGVDPGPSPDTSDNSYAFTGIDPGKWYINLKAGNSAYWSNIYYWNVEVKPEATLEAKVTNDGYLDYTSKCIKALNIKPYIGKINDVHGDRLKINLKNKTVIYLVATPFYGQVIQKEVEFNPFKPTPTQMPSPIPTPISSPTPTPGKLSLFLQRLFGQLSK